ncbi:AbrB/MazE/SpoVT family DNA-binding domain-containing protein [Bosea sp. (in: a-proteobacteria)]|jgi:antitoxin MazE|uniref:AbrB/MazE/SpoVT family DNA-binding domain-containing protein n=1 Tax=Bosea sp. (in: a-proteobacteria) TaxID=1871050 RepID=UPI00356AF96A
MKVQVAKWGNSTAVRLPKAVVKQLGLKPGMTVDVSVEHQTMTLTAHPSQSVRELNGMPNPITIEWMVAEAKRLGGLANAPKDDVDWGPDVGSEVIYDDYNPGPKGT